jgi:ATP-binding cassette subfamily B protein
MPRLPFCPTSKSALARTARRFFSPHRPRIAAIVALALSTSVIAVGEPLLYKELFDAFGSGAGTSAVLLVGALVVALLTREALAALLELVVSKIRIALNADMLRETVDGLHSLPLDHHGGETAGAVMARVERGVAGSVAAFSEIALHLVPSVSYLVLSAIVMASLEWHLSLVVLAFAPLPALIGGWASREQIDRERALMSRWIRVFGRLNEVLSGIAVVRSFVKEEDEKTRFVGGISEASAIARCGVRRDAKVNATKNATMALARVAAIALGGFLVARHEISIGTLVAFVGYVSGVFSPVQALTGMYQTVRKGSVALEAVSSILDAKHSLGDKPDAHDASSLRGDVTFDEVCFGYRAGPEVLRNVRLRVRAGERVALVGPSGAGKTTLMALLQRLYDPCSGRVLLDGKDIRTYKQRSLRSQIGVVLQEGVLFDDTIRDNIAFGRPGASDSEIEAAARSAHAHEFIVKLPRGYDTRVGERGSLLSGGERQRIAIARAILKNAPILVLDEATSALDAESADLVREALERLTRGRTTFVIAHRLSTLRHADRIAVVDSGSIVETGTHDELVEADGRYARLVARQERPFDVPRRQRSSRASQSDVFAA